MTEHDDPKEALRGVLDAFRRGTKKSKLRLLAVVCRNGHTLLEVFPSRCGPVAFWSSRERWSSTDDGELIEHRPARIVWQAAFVEATDEDDGIGLGGGVSVVCRCTEATLVDLDWVHEQLEAGRPRVVAV